ncbi:hypothetical protein [Streptomyces zaomyceticus]|uniref:hypothetical protein n=1 Tax=Streptomyces zaomyceticus TaxID=68286 RepID=UPI00386F62EC
MQDTETSIGTERQARAFLAEPIQLRNIPEGLHLRSVTVESSGLHAHFTGDTVTFLPAPPLRDAPGRAAELSQPSTRFIRPVSGWLVR